MEIHISKSTYERLKQDAKHFEKEYGIPFAYDDVIIEYQKLRIS